MSSLLLWIGVFFFLLLFFWIYTYNKFVELRNLIREAWSGVEVQLKKRHDLIPNLVEIVRQYSQYEQQTLERIAKIRSHSLRPEEVREIAKNEQEVNRIVRTFFALRESYPDLKANEQYLELQKSLKEVEDNLEKARRYYNGTVRNYNIYLESIPSCWVGKFHGFQKAEYFELSSEEEGENPHVEV